MKATGTGGVAGLALACVIAAGISAAAGQSSAQLITQANRAKDAQRYDEAIALYSRALDADPRSVEALTGRTFARVRRGDMNGAQADATALLAIEPNNVKALGFRCGARLGLDDYRGALADCSQSIKLDPTGWGTYSVRGIVRIALKDPAGAIADFTESLALNPRVAETFNNRGLAKDEAGDLAGALEDYQQALALEPTNEDYRADVETVKKRIKPSARRGLPTPVPAPPPPVSAQPALPVPPPLPPLPLPPPLPEAVPAASERPAPAELSGKAVAMAAVRLPSGTPSPKVVTQVDPLYPPMAVKARIQGVVTLDATIAPGGTVVDAAVLKSIPLLDQAAIDAVRQWVYEPTHQKAPIVLTVTVTFALK